MGKKYCIFSAQYLPNLGGVERYTYYIAKNMVKNGDRVTVVTSQMKGMPIHEVSDGIEIYRVPSFELMNGRMPVIKLNGKLRKIKKNLKEKHFDMVIVNTRFYFLSLYGMKFAKKNKIKCITIEHGSGHLTFNNKMLDRFENIYEHGITFFDKLYCRNYYGVSKVSCDWSGHFGIKSKGTLYNAVDVQEIEELVSNPVEDYRKLYNIPEDDIVIAYTGRLLKEKGIPQLLAAIKNMKYKNKIHLLLAGDGPLDDYVTSISEDEKMKASGNEVIKLGRLDFPHIAALLKISDIFCLPSDSEGFPTSVLEAAAARCFVVTTYNGGARELITDDSMGIIMTDNSEATIKNGLYKALSSKEYRMRAADRTYKALVEGFTFEVTVAKINEIADNK